MAKEGGGEGKDETEKTGKKKKIDPEAKPGPKKKPRKTKKAEGEEAGGEGEDDETSRRTPSPRRSLAQPRKKRMRMMQAPLTCGEKLGRLEQILTLLRIASI